VNAVLGAVTTSFLLASPALLSIVNPLAGALIYHQITSDRSHEQRVALARQIGFYAAIVMVVSLWVGAAVMSFFGITINALRIAGGLVVAVRAWEMLSAPEVNEDRKQEQAAPAAAAQGADVAFFPLTMPFTTGPGTISVAIALGANQPANAADLAPFFAGVSAAAVAVAVTVWFAYASADHVVEWLGPARARVVTRLSAFLLLCVGVQILLNGVIDVVDSILARHL
jgi:multiple antibiotic resistance protein